MLSENEQEAVQCVTHASVLPSESSFSSPLASVRLHLFLSCGSFRSVLHLLDPPHLCFTVLVIFVSDDLCAPDPKKKDLQADKEPEAQHREGKHSLVLLNSKAVHLFLSDRSHGAATDNDNNKQQPFAAVRRLGD